MNFVKINSIFSILTILCISCSSPRIMNSELEEISFAEERRLNFPIQIPEFQIINSPEELVNIYQSFHNPEIPRSAPIPVFDKNSESILVLKPKLKQLKYGDLQIERVQKSGSLLIISYKEIESQEFTTNRWSDPIVILKVSEKPSEIQLNKIN